MIRACQANYEGYMNNIMRVCEPNNKWHIKPKDEGYVNPKMGLCELNNRIT